MQALALLFLRRYRTECPVCVKCFMYAECTDEMGSGIRTLTFSPRSSDLEYPNIFSAAHHMGRNATDRQRSSANVTS